MHELLGSAKCVLFDFDGPVCDLFAQRPASAIATRIDAAHRSRAPLPVTGDPQEILAAAHRDPGLLADGTAHAIERALTREEVAAARGASATEHADRLIRELARRGLALAVTTNNSPESVECYLSRERLSRYFEGHVHGRLPGGPLRLKPDPDCVLRALRSTGASAGSTVLIGDDPRDLRAAMAAGVAFVGYAGDAGDKQSPARRARKRRQLREAGALFVVDSLGEVLAAVAPYEAVPSPARLRTATGPRT